MSNIVSLYLERLPVSSLFDYLEAAEGQDHVEHTHSGKDLSMTRIALYMIVCKVPATDESISGQTDLQTQFPITDSGSKMHYFYCLNMTIFFSI